MKSSVPAWNPPIDRATLEKVLDYITHHRQIDIVDMAGLGTGVFCVFDSDGDLDIFFNRLGWELRYPQLWGKSAVLPDFGGVRLGYLSGTGFVPRVRTYDAALQRAKEELRPTSSISEFYPKPLLIDRTQRLAD